MHRTVRQCLVLLLALLPVALTTASAVERTRVLLVTGGARAIEQELIDAVRTKLAVNGGAAIELDVVGLSELGSGELNDVGGGRPNLIVAVGTRASQRLAAQGGDTPVLSVLTPRVSFDEIAREWRKRRGGNGGAQLSAIYLDQSPQRHFALIRALFPQARRVAILLGPSTTAYAGELRAAARDQGLTPLIDSVTAEQNLIHALDVLLPQADVMLALVDPLVFNRTNAQRVLLTAYRYRVPLVGVSPAYVRAGAIAAVHATPAQIGQQLGDVLVSFARNGSRQLPTPQYPQRLAVTVNEQVARSLEVPLPDNHSLEQRLSDRGGQP
jgi:ABC-type uncharacterized transport system substrate-binding protein